MKINYSYISKAPEKAVKACGKDLDVSFKASVNVTKALKGMKLESAMKYLDDVISFKDFIPYIKFCKGAGHRSEVGGKAGPGRYPVKICKEVLKLLISAERNAEHSPGIDTKNLMISHIQASQGVKRKKAKPTGRRATWGTRVTHIQLVLEEMKKKENMPKYKDRKNKEKMKKESHI
ncbi:MAG: 50S ribosomal protein L22 [Candidatus Altiarchaeales archaeon A3]|nr:MAG: 50S ribosomal protein L22 [Candidatus Altiarchaeales archaeon A3]